MSKTTPLIAVIDDEESVRKAIGRLLQSEGLTVETFRGGAEFLAALDRNRPDCAVLDLHMPEMTGFDVLAQLTETHPRVPVVVITGHDTPDAEESALHNGASAYLLKPINDRVLLDAIFAAIEGEARNTPPQP